MHKKLYTVTLGRENLDELMTYMSISHQVDVMVDEFDNISFNIPKKSDVNVKEFDIISEIYNEIDKLVKRRDRLKTNGKRKQELDSAIQGLEKSVEIVSKLIQRG